GNSSTAQQYSYLDADVVAGTTYSYYLTDVSINGDRREHRNLLRSATALSTPVPVEYALSVYPNPFNPTTTVSFSLVDAAKVKLTVYDVTGRVVSTLADKNYTAGTHTVLFDAASLPAGIYFTRIESASFTQTRKMALIK
ncbi:MAG TPA: T9SS type A sorting domain-containing protein, partial [bacterium]